MGLTQSDVVAIAMTAIQVVVAVGFSVWSVRRMSSPPEKTDDDRTSKHRPKLMSFLGSAWPFWLFAAYGIYELILLAQLTAPLRGGQVVMGIFFGCYVLLNILAPVILWLYIRTFGILLHLSGAQRVILENQIGMLSSEKDSLTNASKRSRRKRRAG